ncbi:hypothetical protein FE257_003096 [Aspergillus nanangensis]|uniref:Acyl-coenzyme A oxidase N-terminal domain-containing protein n=1 Tax=Aspergillus nanangensis TaxID=2582783 RepID=A0AAD4GNP3_ASPNN|nr:hypothetical protein FE257_003096 [Aspergillus nanangensis]
MAPPNRQMNLLEQARQSATFDSNILTNLLYDGPETVSSRRAAFQRVEHALSLTDTMTLPTIYHGLTREQHYLEGVRRARATVHDMLTHQHRHFQSLTERYHLANASPFGMNFLMFCRTIELQGTPAQKAHWLPLIDTMEINGAYAQTELGHGTFVRGIATTATFDAVRDEFVLDSGGGSDETG